jgi:hypothetical protein
MFFHGHEYPTGSGLKNSGDVEVSECLCQAAEVSAVPRGLLSALHGLWRHARKRPQRRCVAAVGEWGFESQLISRLIKRLCLHVEAQLPAVALRRSQGQ